MDAAKVIIEMNSTWNKLLSEYFDHVSAEIVRELTADDEEYKNKLELVMSKKTIIMNSNVVDEKKPVTIVMSDEIPGNLQELSRKALQGMCKVHNLPARRKTHEIIADLASIRDKKSANMETPVQEQENATPEEFVPDSDEE
jgi:hypothetical protein